MAPNKGMTQAAFDQQQQLFKGNLDQQPMSPGGSNYPPLYGVSAADWGNSPRPWAFGMPAEASDTRGVLGPPPQGGSLALMGTQRGLPQMLRAANAEYYGQQQAGSPRPPWASSSGALNRTGTLPPIPDSPTRSKLMMSLPPSTPGAFGPSSPLGNGNEALSRTLPGTSSGLSRTLLSLNSSLGPYGTPIRPEDMPSSPSRVQPSVTGFVPRLQGGEGRVPPTPTTTKSRMMPPASSSLGIGRGVGGVEIGSQPAAYGPPRPALSIALPESPKGP